MSLFEEMREEYSSMLRVLLHLKHDEPLAETLVAECIDMHSKWRQMMDDNNRAGRPNELAYGERALIPVLVVKGKGGDR